MVMVSSAGVERNKVSCEDSPSTIFMLFVVMDGGSLSVMKMLAAVASRLMVLGLLSDFSKLLSVIEKFSVTSSSASSII